jgi:hypothetical protein
MAPRADLAGQQVAGWTVSHKAPAQNRVPFWACEHDACGAHADLPHVALTKALAGKGTLPACTTCVPAEERRNIDHGLHLACGTAHLIGTACPTIIEPVRTEMVVNGDTVTTTSHFNWSDFDEPVALPPYSGHPADALPGSAYQMARAKTVEPESTVTFGRVDRLEEPQAILDVIRAGMHGRARNHQSQPGPSQIGGCERKLGYHLAFGSGNGARGDESWRPEVGTAVHAWLDELFSRAGREQGRWLSDVEVTAPIAGRLDLFDTVGNEVIDFKVSGKATRDKAARGEISEKYEVQLDLYGLGMMVEGYTVARVALLFLPPAGSLSDSVWYSRPFDITRALAAVAKRDRIVTLLAGVGTPAGVLGLLSTTEDFCSTCPALGQYCTGAQTAWIPGGLPDSAWPAYDAAVKAAS